MCRADVDIWAKRYKFFALLGGGNWNNGVQTGARAVSLNLYPWYVGAYVGARCACDLVIYRRVALRSNGTTNAIYH